METKDYNGKPQDEFPDMNKYDKPKERTYFVGNKKLKHVKLFEEYSKMNESEAHVSVIVDDIFFLWDEIIDNERKGIERFKKNDKETILFDDDIPNIEDFIKKAQEKLDKANVKYTLTPGMLVLESEMIDVNEGKMKEIWTMAQEASSLEDFKKEALKFVGMDQKEMTPEFNTFLEETFKNAQSSVESK